MRKAGIDSGRIVGGAAAALRAGRRGASRQARFWLLALLVGAVSGVAALLFRKGVEALQAWLYGTGNVAMLHSAAEALPWQWIVLIPAMGGLAVGLILRFLVRGGSPHSVAEVIEGAALREGRVPLKPGIASAAASFVTLSTGGSSGREGPVVHMAALVSSWVSDRIRADGVTGRDLLGCAVAAAVSASFNAPIAGALFALEVVLRHFAVHAFAPIAIASVAGTIVGRLHAGDVTEFALPNENVLEFYLELPAFLILGLVCGLVAAALMRAIFLADDLAGAAERRAGLPAFLRPAVAGLLLGAMAVFFPHIIGVGYETTSLALTGELLLWQAVAFAAVKVAAVAITIGGRMGGGVFSPSLMLGALVGLAFGLVATSVFPEVSGAETLYALAGMGALAAAVLGAPISTTLIAFELTGDWQTGLAVMASVSMSTLLASRLVDRSFFLTVLERRGVHVAAGPQAYLPGAIRVADVARPLAEGDAAIEAVCREMAASGVRVGADAMLEEAMPVFDEARAAFLPVVAAAPDPGGGGGGGQAGGRGGGGSPPELVGVLHHVDALRAVNRALSATAREEHS